MRTVIGITGLILAMVTGGGCGESPKGGQATVIKTDDSNSTNGLSSADGMQRSAPMVTTNVGLSQLQLLNRAMIGWEMKNQRRPQTFQEFASTANIPIPDPPAGQKYALNPRGFIVLVNSTQ